MEQPPLVVSFYTEPFQAKLLLASCRVLGIEAEIEPLPSQQAAQSCAMKPFFIRQKLLEKKRPLFWVNADSVFKKKPDFSFLLESDLSFRTMKGFTKDKRFKYTSDSLFINYTPRALEFADKWCEHCQLKIDNKDELELADQIILIDLIDRGHILKVLPLPISYCKVFDFDAEEVHPQKIVVEHFLTSPRFRHWRS